MQFHHWQFQVSKAQQFKINSLTSWFRDTEWCTIEEPKTLGGVPFIHVLMWSNEMNGGWMVGRIFWARGRHHQGILGSMCIHQITLVAFFVKDNQTQTNSYLPYFTLACPCRCLQNKQRKIHHSTPFLALLLVLKEGAYAVSYTHLTLPTKLEV